MISLYQLTSPPESCSYLPEQRSSTEYLIVARSSASDYEQYMLRGWRRFGRVFFHPVCPQCQACQSLRIPVATFRPDRSQRRAWKRNQDVRLRIGKPSVSPDKLALYDRYHRFQAQTKGWPWPSSKTAEAYVESFVDNPFPTEEWCYFLAGRLIGVGYVDVLESGLSAIYFFSDPDDRDRSLGTYNVLQVIAQAASRSLSHVYLGYYVRGCRSLEYKARFRPNEVLGSDGRWQLFLTA